jgi:ATP-binding cassette subfamily C protein
MAEFENTRGLAELRAARSESRSLLVAVMLFSAVVNMLMLTGPIYMLQIYDRVLGSRSEETLLVLSLFVAFLFLAMGLVDHARGRVTARVGARFQERLDRRVFSAAVRMTAVAPNDTGAIAAQRDLEAVRGFLASPVLLALFDLPWTPFFVAAIFVFHPILGFVAVGGGLLLIVVTVLNQTMTQKPIADANMMTLGAERISDQIKAEAETVQSLGMRGAAFARWVGARREATARTMAAGDLAGAFQTGSKTFRLFLQSAILGVGAWLVLQNQLTAGAMIAASILLGRALAPIEVAVSQWAVAQRAQEGWRRLSVLLSRVPPEPEVLELPRPRAHLDAQAVTVVPPGEQVPVLRGVSFQLEPGQALGVIGPSGAGKSTLARAICGLWRPAQGKIRLDGAALDQYDPDRLGSYIGYLPQRITLFDGTIAENIARLSARPDPEAVVAAARKAAAHEMILQFPQGYDTRVSSVGGRLSGGQMQRIGLARALYGDPVLLVLDEPNSNLDNDGSMALNLAIRGMKDAGKAVIIMAHRPAAIQECDVLLVLEGGVRTAFGPRDQVLRSMVKNHTEIIKQAAPGGVA